MISMKKIELAAFTLTPALVISGLLSYTGHSWISIILTVSFYVYLLLSSFCKFSLESHKQAIKKSLVLLFISFLPILVTLIFVERHPDGSFNFPSDFFPVLGDAFALNAQFIFATSLLGPVIFVMWDGFSRLVVTDPENRNLLRPTLNKKHQSVATLWAISAILLLCMALIYAQHITNTGTKYIFYTVLSENSFVVYLLCLLIWYFTTVMEFDFPELDKDPLGTSTAKFKEEFEAMFTKGNEGASRTDGRSADSETPREKRTAQQAADSLKIVFKGLEERK